MRPLVKRAPNGRAYLVPSTVRYPATVADPQPAEDTGSGPEPTPEQASAPADRTVKVTAEDVRAIRSDYAAGKWSQADLAYIYGITQNTVSRIIRGQAHTEPTPTEQDS